MVWQKRWCWVVFMLFLCLLLSLFRGRKLLFSPTRQKKRSLKTFQRTIWMLTCKPDWMNTLWKKLGTLFRFCLKSKTINEFGFLLRGWTASSLSVQSQGVDLWNTLNCIWNKKKCLIFLFSKNNVSSGQNNERKLLWIGHFLQRTVCYKSVSSFVVDFILLWE